jgi:hypothetical protein
MYVTAQDKTVTEKTITNRNKIHFAGRIKPGNSTSNT